MLKVKLEHLTRSGRKDLDDILDAGSPKMCFSHKTAFNHRSVFPLYLP